LQKGKIRTPPRPWPPVLSSHSERDGSPAGESASCLTAVNCVRRWHFVTVCVCRATTMRSQIRQSDSKPNRKVTVTCPPASPPPDRGTAGKPSCQRCLREATLRKEKARKETDKEREKKRERGNERASRSGERGYLARTCRLPADPRVALRCARGGHPNYRCPGFA